MADVTQLRFAQLLKAVLGLKAIDPGRTVSPVMQASFDLVDNYAPEFRLSRGERLFSKCKTLNNGAGAGNFGWVEFRNPVGSSRLCVIERVRWSGTLPTAAAQPGRLYAVLNIGQTGAVSDTTNPKDLRLGNGATAITSSGLTASLTQGVMATSFFANSTCLWVQEVVPGATAQSLAIDTGPIELVLPPGTAIDINFIANSNTVTAYDWTFTIEGFERVMDPNELLYSP